MKKWFFQTKDLTKVGCYHSDDDANPLETIEDFDRGDAYSMDCREAVDARYPLDPEDDSFVLIPKADILRVWCEPFDNMKTIG